MKTVPKPIAEGDRVEFLSGGSIWPATGTVKGIWTEYGIQVARVEADPDPFVLSGSHQIDVADLKRIRGPR